MALILILVFEFSFFSHKLVKVLVNKNYEIMASRDSQILLFLISEAVHRNRRTVLVSVNTSKHIHMYLTCWVSIDVEYYCQSSFSHKIHSR